jgi:hypothetical protein
MNYSGDGWLVPRLKRRMISMKLWTSALVIAGLALGTSMAVAQTAEPGQYEGGASAPRASGPTATTKKVAAKKKMSAPKMKKVKSSAKMKKGGAPNESNDSQYDERH